MHIENPELVQPEDWARPEKTTHNTPVFLIHDGGGTTFSYHCLEPLSRYVYGIANPYFRTGDVFTGGLPEMASLYSKWIKDTVMQHDFPFKRKNFDGSTNILLGGWSLGGLLSLEVASQLANDPVVRVAGILMVDSVFPGKSIRALRRAASPESDTASDASSDVASDTASEASSDSESLGMTKNQILSQRCMNEAARMVREWSLPEWNLRLGRNRPRCILLRATEYIPTLENRGIAGLDLNREDRILGWGEYDEDMFLDAIDVDGHHFNLFAFERLDSISRAIKRGLDRLDQYSQIMAFADGLSYWSR